MKLLSISATGTRVSRYLIPLTPLMINIPCSLSLFHDKKCGMSFYSIVRGKKKQYYWSKLLAVFIVTTIVFSLPFIIEIILNCISFPLEATGDQALWSVYSVEGTKAIRSYLLTSLYVYSPYLYSVCLAFFFGAFCGLFACFTLTITALSDSFLGVFYYIPTFAILYLSGTVYVNEPYLKYNWTTYLFLFNTREKSVVFLLFILFIIAFVIIGTQYAIQKDEL